MHWCVRDLSSVSHQELEEAYASLSPSRKEHIDRLRKNEDKHRSLAAQLLVQQLLRDHYGIHTAQLHRKSNGQPYLTGCELYVSISHSGNKIACAVSEEPVGIDIERIHPTNLNICRHLCVPEEAQYILGDGIQEKTGVWEDPEVLRRLFEIWTAKEACFKKAGTGITDLKSVNVLPLPRQIYQIEDYILQII